MQGIKLNIMLKQYSHTYVVYILIYKWTKHKQCLFVEAAVSVSGSMILLVCLTTETFSLFRVSFQSKMKLL